MKQKKEIEFYEERKDWDFSKFEIESESLTNFDFYEKLKEVSNSHSRILDLGTGGGEKVLSSFPECLEILGTDLSPGMIETANINLKASKKKNITFRVMDNLHMDVEKDYYDVVVARNTVTDPKQIYSALKEGGYLLIHGVDQYDCHSLKYLFGRGQAFKDTKPISVIDYEHVLDAGFHEVELIPICEREYFMNREIFKAFLEKVPILNDFSEIDGTDIEREIEDNLLDQYILENLDHGKIKLLRRYYAIVAKK